MTIYFEIFNPLSKWKAGDYPLSPQVAIRVSTYRTESDGAVTIGPYLGLDVEIDHAIDVLIKELNEIRKEAKRELKASVKKQLKAVSEKRS